MLPLVTHATAVIVHILRHKSSHFNQKVSFKERNRVIRARWKAGKSQAALAREFGVSYQRIHQIVGNDKHCDR